MVYIVLENIRSAFNVGNIIRSADGFGFDIIISGYTPSPFKQSKVLKTSLGAEKSVEIKEFWETKKCLEFLQKNKYTIIVAEYNQNSECLSGFSNFKNMDCDKIAIIFGNEKQGVLEESLEYTDKIYHIPMQGQKESFNVSQAAAIFMWEVYLKKKL